ncbi:MAG: Aminobenzoyl-glutamate utilization protein B [Cytophagales bacterium]|jgi:aminobenzoyl-glutamate utilization protein B|nr:amidohydrolase [Bacteroidota bacterium]MBS1982126.1 amidohydrolase [Bacteroidota bacterium]WHZ06400.1 MAG: Aminobenzoyl-glutamate utilization protein B [Cytophagales bacterium]
MKNCALFLTLLLVAHLSVAQKTKQEIFKALDANYDFYSSIAQKIWGYAEVGYQETQSSALLQQTLKDAGFTVETGIAGEPTAFIATAGSGKPVIAVLGEFDALPGVSQEAVPELKPIAGQKAGHACGHHLFGTASAAAAIAVKNWLAANKKSGTIKFYGCPAEEGGSGKVYMVRDGYFKNVDLVFHWHPGATNSANFGTSLANKSGKFRFYGVAAHAAASPERGRSALDAVEAMDMMVNMLREHVNEKTRIHYVITRGGEAPNVVPAFAEVYYYVRHPDRQQVKDIWERVTQAAQGAAQGTGTRFEVELTGGTYNLIPNETLAQVVNNNLQLAGGYVYTDSEKEFATQIQQTITSPPPLTTTAIIEKFGAKNELGGASTDVGDISWVVPTAGFSTATWVPGTAAHSWQAVAAGGTSIGKKGMIIAAKTLAGSLIDAFSDTKITENAWTELKKQTGTNFTYESLLGDRKPALDYRK